MDPWELYVSLIKIAKYRYPYKQIAVELDVTRQAVWYECNGKETSYKIRKYIADKLHMKVDDIFPIKSTKRQKRAA